MILIIYCPYSHVCISPGSSSMFMELAGLKKMPSVHIARVSFQM